MKLPKAAMPSAPFGYASLPYAMYEPLWMSKGPMPVWMMPRAPAVAALVGHPAAVREVLVDAEVHLRLAGPPFWNARPDVRRSGRIGPAAGEDVGEAGRART